MSWPASLVLYLIHRLYSLAIFFSRLSQLVRSSSPLPIDAPRRLLPKHVAIIFFAEGREQGADAREEEDEMIVETICKCVDWCQAAGIARLSIYDRHGNAIRCSSRIQNYLYASETSLDEDSTTHTRITHTETKIDHTMANNEYEYPLTPPATDSSSESRSHSPDSESKETELDPATIIEYEVPARPVGSSSLLRSFAGKRKGQGNGLRRRQSKGVADQQHCMSKRNPLQLSFLSYATSKPSLAAIARSLVRSRRVARRLLARANDAVEDRSASLTVDALERAIQESTQFSPPDLLLVHHFMPTGPLEPPLELDGFPPWQIRLTEMQALSKWRLGMWPWRNKEGRWNRLEEVAFREALDEFAGAEMRLGK